MFANIEHRHSPSLFALLHDAFAHLSLAWGSLFAPGPYEESAAIDWEDGEA